MKYISAKRDIGQNIGCFYISDDKLLISDPSFRFLNTNELVKVIDNVLSGVYQVYILYKSTKYLRYKIAQIFVCHESYSAFHCSKIRNYKTAISINSGICGIYSRDVYKSILMSNTAIERFYNQCKLETKPFNIMKDIGVTFLLETGNKEYDVIEDCDENGRVIALTIKFLTWN